MPGLVSLENTPHGLRKDSSNGVKRLRWKPWDYGWKVVQLRRIKADGVGWGLGDGW